MSHSWAALFLLLLPLGLLAQDEVYFETRAEAKQVIMGNHFRVSFVLGNARGTDFRPPPLNDFEKLTGRSSSSSTTIINGRKESTLSYSYVLQPKRKGKLTIGPASIKVGGKEYKTQAVTIEVLEGKTNTSPSKAQGEMFVKAILSDSSVVTGQQVYVDYVVYTSVQINSTAIVDEDDYSGFVASVIRSTGMNTSTEVIQGVQYTTKLIRRVALYPQQAGTFQLQPIKLRVGVPISGGNSNINDPFGILRPSQTHFLSSEPMSLEVRPLPSPVPASFSGAVGQYKAHAVLDRFAATTDDAITLQIKVEGKGDIERVTAPDFQLPNSFEVYEPSVFSEEPLERSGELYGRKVFEYLILPKVPGTHIISPSFTYYNPDLGQFVENQLDTFSVKITKGRYNTNVNVKPETVAKPKEEISGLKAGMRTVGRSRFWGSSLFWSLFALPLLALTGAVVHRYIQANRPAIDPAAHRSQQAQQVARQRLAEAEKHLRSSHYRAFYDETSKVLLGYAADKFNIPGSELSKSNVEEKLRQSGAEEGHIQRFMSLIQTCEKAVFALGSDGDAAQTYQDALGVIVDIEM